MTPDERSVWQALRRHPKAARDAFIKTFGVSPEHSSIGLELLRLTKTAFANGDEAVKLPGRVALALLMRPGGTGRKPGDKRMTPQRRRAIARAVKEAVCRECELIEGGMKMGKAEEQAAQEACERLTKGGWHPPAKGTIADEMQKLKSAMNKDLKEKPPRGRRPLIQREKIYPK